MRGVTTVARHVCLLVILTYIPVTERINQNEEKTDSHFTSEIHSSFGSIGALVLLSVSKWKTAKHNTIDASIYM